MHDLDRLAVAANRLDGIAAALLVVRDVEQQSDGARRAVLHDRFDGLGRLSRAVHVMVIDERHAEASVRSPSRFSMSASSL